MKRIPKIHSEIIRVNEKGNLERCIVVDREVDTNGRTYIFIMNKQGHCFKVTKEEIYKNI